MNDHRSLTPSTSHPARRQAAARRWRPAFATLTLACACAASLIACGGGGGEPTATAPLPQADPPRATAAAVQAWTEGTVTGFGSVIVNGVRYDDSAAEVIDDLGRRRDASSLRLGMRAEVTGTAADAAGNARADRIAFGSRLIGPVESVDAAAGTLTVLGQVVTVSDTTVIDSALAADLASLTVGRVVEVHGVPAAAGGATAATRLEAPHDGADAYKLSGTVAALDTAARSFQIGSARLSYAGVTDAALPAGLADGSSVRLTLSPTPAADGTWTVQAFNGSGKGGRPTDAGHAHVRGAITAWASAMSFTVDGTPVDASAATFPDGQAGVVLGAQVEVRGALVNGTLVAQTVSLESRHHRDADRSLRLHGAIASIDAATRTFVLRGVTVTWDDATTVFTNGMATQLATGVRVEVRGVVDATRTKVAASSIRFE